MRAYNWAGAALAAALLLAVFAGQAVAVGEEAAPEPPAETSLSAEAAPASEECEVPAEAEAEVEPPAETEAPTEADAEAETEESVPANVALTFRLPAYDGALDTSQLMYSSDIIQLKLLQLKEVYYEGYPWSSSVMYHGANGCTAFAWMFSDLLFTDLPYSHYYNNGDYSYSNIHAFSYDDIHIGDLVYNNKYPGSVVTNSHVSVVVEKTEDYITVAEGTYPTTVHWGRKITRQELEGFRAVWTRYPDHMIGDVTGDKCVEAYDAALLLKGLANWDLTGLDAEAGDVDGDYGITPADIAGILKLTAMKADGRFLMIQIEE